jgi:hypothetical protein
MLDFFVESMFSSVGIVQALVWLSVFACAIATARSRAWKRFAMLAVIAWVAWSVGAIVLTPPSPRVDDLQRTVSTMAALFAVAIVPAALLFGVLVRRGAHPLAMFLAGLPLLVVQAAASGWLTIGMYCWVGRHCVS